MDEDNLRYLWTTLPRGNNDFDELLQSVDRRLESLDSLYADVDMDAQPEPPQRTWRIRVRTIVQAIIEPDEISWMDDDESMSDTQYIARAFSEVENRFER